MTGVKTCALPIYYIENEKCVINKKECKFSSRIDLLKIIKNVLNREIKSLLNNKYRLEIVNFKYEYKGVVFVL